jgi:rare lipoprotein A
MAAAARPTAPAAARVAAAMLASAAALLGGCASSPDGRPTTDGPEARPPPGLAQVPDAVPRIEALRSGGPNKPYRINGRSYTPMTDDLPLQEEGLASWYGRKFHGQRTSNGEVYDMYAMTAAHKTMPLPSYARVRNPANGREIIVRINDRGPFADGRVIDLSYTAALKLGVLAGVAPVQVQRITFDEIRSGRWQQPRDEAVAAAPSRKPPVVLDDALPGDRAPVGFWLQVGAFRQFEGAQQLQRQLLATPQAGVDSIAVFEEAGLFRVQAGPYATRADAQQAAERVRRHTGRSPLLVDRSAP